MEAKKLLELTLSHPEDLVEIYFRDKDGLPLKLASYQADFVREIINKNSQRVVFVAATQAGKSMAISTAIALYAVLHPNERIVNVSYTDAQAKIIFEQTKELLLGNPITKELIDLRRTIGSAKEFSKTRMFLKNGTEIRVLSTGAGETEKTGESLLGFEATLLIVDEASSIPDSVFRTKILRMIGARTGKGWGKMLVLSGTPHHRGFFEDCYHDSLYKKFVVDWRMAVREGRLDEKTVNEQREKMSSFEFDAWYNAIFPSMTEDSLFDMKEVERNVVKSDLPRFDGLKILSVDVARFGQDKSVYTLLDYVNDSYRIVDIISDFNKDLMGVTGHIMSLHQQFGFDRVIVDSSGIGGGVADRLKEQGIKSSEFVSGMKCTTDEVAKTCLNLKAEVYMKAKKLFEQNKLKILPRRELLRDLSMLRRDFQSNGKIKVIDPEKSPDFSDSLVMGLWVPSQDKFVWLEGGDNFI